MTSMDEKMELMKSLDEAFREVRKLIQAEWNRENEHALGMTHGRMLILLSESGPLKASVLAEGLQITSGGVTGIADRLIELGYVKRERSEEDRRAVMLMLTNSGEAMIEEMLKVRKKIMIKLFRGMDDEDMARALDIFTKMKNNMEQED